MRETKQMLNLAATVYSNPVHFPKFNIIIAARFIIIHQFLAAQHHHCGHISLQVLGMDLISK